MEDHEALFSESTEKHNSAERFSKIVNELKCAIFEVVSFPERKNVRGAQASGYDQMKNVESVLFVGRAIVSKQDVAASGKRNP